MLEFSKMKMGIIVGVCLLGILYAIPNFVSKKSLEGLPEWAPHQQVNLGLDLQGGSHLILEVDVNAVFTELLNNNIDDISGALKAEKIQYSALKVDGDAIALKLTNSDDFTRLPSLLRSKKIDMEIAKDGLSGVRLILSEALKNERLEFALEQSMEVVRRRVDELGTREPTIQRQGRDRILVQLPGLDDPTHIKNLLGKTAKMTFHLADDEYIKTGRRRPGTMLVPHDKNPAQKTALLKRVMVSGDSLVDSRPQLGEHGDWVVSFRFDSTGTRRFGKATKENVGKIFAIVLDGKIIMEPRIKVAIMSGSGVIEGSFTAQEANDMSLLMRSGALPAPLTVIEERSVGPDLGADSILAGEMACVIAFVLVLVLMFVYYGKFGLVSNIALLFNLVILLALLSVLQATLTLPGIAGIVLTLGMAVDANVVIFERIQEELDQGHKPFQAIEIGYERALTSIIDSNITTLIAAAILFFLGTGPVKGFAVTLALGLMSSMFTAILLTRLMIAKWYVNRRMETIRVHLMLLIPSKTSISFINRRKFMFMLSILLVGGSIGSVVVKGLNFGVDFKGGILMEVRMPEAADLSDMRTRLNKLDLGEAMLQEFGQNTDVLIRIEKQDGGEKEQAAAVLKVKAELGDKVDYRRTEFVGPKVGGELIQDGILAISLALLAIMFYVWMHFDWQFGLCAVVALFHDVIATIGLFSFTQIEFNLTIVAALLTILGYSINDTVIIYDRVRENLKKYRTMELKDLINISINATLSRTIMTSGTTLIAVLALYIFGGYVISGLSLALLWGVIIGTYSSICIAVPLLVSLNINRKLGEEADDTKGQFGDGVQV